MGHVLIFAFNHPNLQRTFWSHINLLLILLTHFKSIKWIADDQLKTYESVISVTTVYHLQHSLLTSCHWISFMEVSALIHTLFFQHFFLPVPCLYLIRTAFGNVNETNVWLTSCLSLSIKLWLGQSLFLFFFTFKCKAFGCRWHPEQFTNLPSIQH